MPCSPVRVGSQPGAFPSGKGQTPLCFPSQTPAKFTLKLASGDTSHLRPVREQGQLSWWPTADVVTGGWKRISPFKPSASVCHGGTARYGINPPLFGN